jgi:POTRA domain, FtsQ-type
MTTVEPRVAQRRKGVSEDRARHRLRRILIIIAVVAVGALGFWLLRSPFLSISEVIVTGTEMSNPAGIIEDLGVVVGIPTIDVDAGAITEAVEADPWIASADVSVQWPGTVTVDVTEHVAIAPAAAGSGFVMLSDESTVIEAVSGPIDGVFLVDVDVADVPIGEPVDDPLVAGALAFGQALRPDLGRDAVMYVEDGGLAATVGGFVVRLGRPIDIEEKALVLASLIDSGLEPGAEINLIAPSRPAVLNPQAEVEDEQ